MPPEKAVLYVRSSSQVNIPPYSELAAKVRLDYWDLVSIDPLWVLTAKRNISVTNEIVDVENSGLYFIYISNLGST